MARGKYPELTVQRILNASLRLFIGQGYERTSIQDITEALGDLTKGAIYHHFKSKEDILFAVVDRMFARQDKDWQNIASDQSMTGAEKLTAIFLQSVSTTEQLQFFKTAPNLLDNPKLLVAQMQGLMKEAAPHYVLPIIEGGIADGSIHTKHPKQLAEVILLLVNLWVTPMVFYADWDEMWERLECFDELLAPCGVSLCNSAMKNRFRELSQVYSQNK
jgi:AcrR family transcriptional regulator